MTEYVGRATELHWDPMGGTAWKKIAQIRDLSLPSFSREEIDTSHRDQNFWRTFAKGMKDAGEIGFDIMFDPQLASHGTASASGLLADFANDGTALPNWKIVFPDTTEWTCLGFVSGFDGDSPQDDALTADLSIKLSGEPSFG